MQSPLFASSLLSFFFLECDSHVNKVMHILSCMSLQLLLDFWQAEGEKSSTFNLQGLRLFLFFFKENVCKESALPQ